MRSTPAVPARRSQSVKCSNIVCAEQHTKLIYKELIEPTEYWKAYYIEPNYAQARVIGTTLPTTATK